MKPQPCSTKSATGRARDSKPPSKLIAETTGIKLGKLAQPLRAALTGTNTSPGIFDVLEVLGREESLARIKDQLSLIDPFVAVQ